MPRPILIQDNLAPLYPLQVSVDKYTLKIAQNVRMKVRVIFMELSISDQK